VAGKPTYRMGGISCLAGDFMGNWSFDKELKPGDKIVFDDMIHYTTVKTTMFNGVSHPSIGIWTENSGFRLIKEFNYQDYKNRLSWYLDCAKLVINYLQFRHWTENILGLSFERSIMTTTSPSCDKNHQVISSPLMGEDWGGGECSMSPPPSPARREGDNWVFPEQHLATSSLSVSCPKSMVYCPNCRQLFTFLDSSNM